jgi:drug/metabolite transporter (DMT)-like permease
MPFDFLRLPMAVGWGWFFFAEPTNTWTWIGATVIFATTYFIAWRESRQKLRPN